jgi:serine/threonine-protein kinase RsbW
MKEEFKIIEQLRIASNLDEVGKIESLVDKVCADLGVNEEFYGNVLIAVTEAVNNAIQHGNADVIGAEVFVSVGHSENEFVFNITDMGRGFDYENLPDPTSPENLLKENGRGIFLMKNLSDLVEFEDQGKSVFIYFNK